MGCRDKTPQVVMAKYKIQLFSKTKELLDTIECCVEENARFIAERASKEDSVWWVLVNLGGGKYVSYTNGVED